MQKSELEQIKQAVSSAEANTAGEIMVCIVESSSGWVDRLVLSRNKIIGKVDKRAEAEFMSLGIQQTAGRTGVLLFVSLKEQVVIVKADKDINDKVDPGVWGGIVRIVTDSADGTLCSGICIAVATIGVILSEHFPKKDDVNELPDEVVVRE